MPKIYEGIKNFVLKPILCTGLAAIALTGCDNTNTSKQNQPMEVKKEIERAYFDNWGFVAEVTTWKQSLDIELGDFDGDGDLDIVLATFGSLRVYENRIPQKK